MDNDFYDYGYVAEEEWPVEWPRDVKIDEARQELTEFFNQRAEEVFYLNRNNFW